MNVSNVEQLGLFSHKRRPHQPFLKQKTLFYMMITLGFIVCCEYIGMMSFSTITTTTTTKTTKCLRYTGIFMVLSGLWILFSSLIGWRIAFLHERNYQYSITAKTRWGETLLSILVCGGYLIFGIAGLVLGSQKACQEQQQQQHQHEKQQPFAVASHWIVYVVLAIGALFLVGTVFLIGRFVYKSIKNMAPGQETFFALVCIRCSCISEHLRHVLLTIPCLILCLLNGFFTSEIVDLSKTLEAKCSSSFGSSSSVIVVSVRHVLYLLYTTTTVYAIMFLLMTLSSFYYFYQFYYYYYSSSIPLATPVATTTTTTIAAATATPVATTTTTTTTTTSSFKNQQRRTLRRIIVLGVIFLFAIVCMVCASIGSVWIKNSSSSIKSSQDLTCSNSNEDVSLLEVHEEMLDFARAAVIELFVTGIGLFIFGCCCRMEECFIPNIIHTTSLTENSIEISMTMGNLLQIPDSKEKSEIKAFPC